MGLFSKKETPKEAAESLADEAMAEINYFQYMESYAKTQAVQRHAGSIKREIIHEVIQEMDIEPQVDKKTGFWKRR